MLIAFNIMQDKDRSIPFRQIRNGSFEGDPIHRAHQVQIRVAVFLLRQILVFVFRLLIQRNFIQTLLPKVHKNNVDRQPMKPSRKSRFTSKGANFSKQLHEGFLGKILSFSRVADHAQAERINSALMQAVKPLKSPLVSGKAASYGLLLNCLGRGCCFAVQSVGLEVQISKAAERSLLQKNAEDQAGNL